MTNTMFEFETKNDKVMDKLEKVFEENWAFIIGQTRKENILRVLGPAKDVQQITQQGKLSYDEQEQVLVKIIPDKEWVSDEK